MNCWSSRCASRSRNLELLDLLFDFVHEVRGAGAVHDTMIECKRERDHLDRFAFRSVAGHLEMRRADEERADRRWHDDRRRCFNAERAETADDDRRVHRIDATTACL